MSSACSLAALEVAIFSGGLSALGGAEANAANAADDAANDAEAEQDDHDDPDGDGLASSISEIREIYSLSRTGEEVTCFARSGAISIGSAVDCDICAVCLSRASLRNALSTSLAGGPDISYDIHAH